MAMSTVLIIGASSGIGQQLAKQLAASGQTVIGTYKASTDNSNSPGLTFHYYNVLMTNQISVSYLTHWMGSYIVPGVFH